MAGWTSHFGQDAEDDDEEENDGGQVGQRDGLIFLIDTSKGMFNDTIEEASLFKLCIKCAKCVAQNKIISSERDLLGVVLFGCNSSKNPSDFKHIYILQDLEQPGAPCVLQLNEYLLDTEAKKLGHSEDFSLSEALWTCQNMFANCTMKLGYKRIMLFTNNEDPHRGKVQLRKQAKSKAVDLHETGVNLELMHIHGEGNSFDVEKFYRDLLFTDNDEDTELPDPVEKFEELLVRVRSKDHKKRAMSRITLCLGEGLNLGVGVYNLVRSCTKPSGVTLSRENNEQLKSKRNIVLKDTGEALMPHDIKKYVTFGGRKIALEKDEIDEIKQFELAGLTLMGFKPLDSLKVQHYIRPAQFIYPDESTVEGSTTLFTALLQKCVERKVMGICKYIPRRNQPPKFVALLPQEEELDADLGIQLTPPGFHVLFLPYSDDIRKTPCEEKRPRANPDQIDKAKDIIKKLKFKYSADSFENPVLQNHYRNVEAFALDLDSPEAMTDYTMPDEHVIQKRAGDLIAQFKDIVFPEDYSTNTKKRKPQAESKPGAAKKPKVEGNQASDGSLVDVLRADALAGKLSKHTVPVLKDFIKQIGIKSTGTKKANLVDAINEHFNV